MTAMKRGERVAANRAAIAAKLGPAGFAVRGVLERSDVRDHGSNELRYVEVGKCSTCKLTWRTNLTGGEVKKHGPADRPCRGSHKAPLAHAVVLKDLYKPGEPWPKKKA